MNGRLLAARPIESDHILFCSFFFFGGGGGGVSLLLLLSLNLYVAISIFYLSIYCLWEGVRLFWGLFFIFYFFILLFLSLSYIALLIAHSLFSNFHRPQL